MGQRTKHFGEAVMFVEHGRDAIKPKSIKAILVNKPPAHRRHTEQRKGGGEGGEAGEEERQRETERQRDRETEHVL